MPKKKTTKKPRKSTAKKGNKKSPRLRRKVSQLDDRRKKFLSRRPHRSFRLTLRRDYRRSLKIPGYWSLTAQTIKIIWNNKAIFLGTVFLFALLALLTSSVMSQDAYSQLKELIFEVRDEGVVGTSVATFSLFLGVLNNNFSGSLNSADASTQMAGLSIGLFTWLTTIWLMRAVMAGKKPRVRDGVYSSGGPVVALFILALVMLIQMVPAALAIMVYGAADQSELLKGTATLMLAGGALILIIVLSAYWVTSTFLAMIIVTLPGMYPFRALSLAGDIVVGRRVRILLRLSWMAFCIMLAWSVVLIPMIIIDGFLKQTVPSLEWLPLIPISALLLSTFSIVFSASYIYLFYRKVVEDDSPSA